MKGNHCRYMAWHFERGNHGWDFSIYRPRFSEAGDLEIGLDTPWFSFAVYFCL